jgi:hypothetical protein
VKLSAILGEFSAILGEFSATLGEFSATLEEFSATFGEFSATLGEFSATLGELSAILGELSEMFVVFSKAIATGNETSSNRLWLPALTPDDNAREKIPPHSAINAFGYIIVPFVIFACFPAFFGFDGTGAPLQGSACAASRREGRSVFQ